MNKNIHDVQKVLDFTLKLVSNLDEYIAFTNFFPQDLNKEQVLDKLIAETALLLLLASRISNHERVSSIISEIARKITPYARSSRHLFLLSNNPQSVLAFGLSHVALNKLGFYDQLFDDVVEAAFSSRFSNSLDRPNFRQMEMRWLRDLAKGVSSDFSDLILGSLIMKPAHPIYMRREDAYAITHALMYITNFGEDSVNSTVNIDFLDSFIDHSISWCLSYSDWDLLIEVLIVDSILHRPLSNFHKIAIHVLDSIFNKDGLITGPNFNQETYNAIKSEDREAYFFLHGYHSTYVYGILKIIEIVNHSHDAANSEKDEFDVYTKLQENINGLDSSKIMENAGHGFSQEWMNHPIITGSIGGMEVLLNAKLIYFAREGLHNELLCDIELFQNNGMKRVMETCEVASEKIMQIIRSAAYKCNVQ